MLSWGESAHVCGRLANTFVVHWATLWGCKMCVNATWYSIKSMEVVGWSCRNISLQNVVSHRSWCFGTATNARACEPGKGGYSHPKWWFEFEIRWSQSKNVQNNLFVLAREPHNLSFEYEHAKETPSVGSTLSRFIPSTRNWVWMTRPCPWNFILQLRRCPVKLLIV